MAAAARTPVASFNANDGAKPCWQRWAGTIRASIDLIDGLDGKVRTCESELRQLGVDHPYAALLRSIPGVSWVLG